MENLIFDRTQADVTYAAELNRKLNSGEALTAQELADWNAGLKGTYNATDMNRVDAAVRELGRLLTEAGYPVEYVDPHPSSPSNSTSKWMYGDIINMPIWVQYIQNVQNIIDEYYTMTGSPELPEPIAPLTFDGANAIEKLLYDISRLYDAMIASYRPCGTFKCGSNAQHLPLQRSVI